MADDNEDGIGIKQIELIKPENLETYVDKNANKLGVDGTIPGQVSLFVHAGHVVSDCGI